MDTLSEDIAYQQTDRPQGGSTTFDDLSEKLGGVAYEGEAERGSFLPRSLTQHPPRRLTTKSFGGVIAAMVYALLCIIGGVYVVTVTHEAHYSGSLNDPDLSNSGTQYAKVRGIIAILSPSPSTKRLSAISLVFSVLATICTEAIGFMHSTALRSTLIAEGRLEFNTNPRLFTASKKQGWASPNGRLMNGIMAMLLVLSYASSALIIMKFEVGDPDTAQYQAWLTAPPIIVLGLSLLLQGVIALCAAYSCSDMMDSSGVLAMTSQQIEHGHINRRASLCMHNVLQVQSTTKPLEPLNRQPSAWSAHPTVKRGVVISWCLIPFYVVWGGVIAILSQYAANGSNEAGTAYTDSNADSLSDSSWAFSPSDYTQDYSVQFFNAGVNDDSTSLPWQTWPVMLFIFALIQSGLTLGLHCCEAIINATRDEEIWRKATSSKGAALSAENPLRAAIGSWRNVFLLIAKPFLRRSSSS